MPSREKKTFGVTVHREEKQLLLLLLCRYNYLTDLRQISLILLCLFVFLAFLWYFKFNVFRLQDHPKGQLLQRETNLKVIFRPCKVNTQLLKPLLKCQMIQITLTWTRSKIHRREEQEMTHDLVLVIHMKY